MPFSTFLPTKTRLSENCRIFFKNFDKFKFYTLNFNTKRGLSKIKIVDFFLKF